jgi:hypothetical protein
MKTTLSKIRAHRPCLGGWEKLLRGLGKTAADDEIIWIDEVLDHNGLNDALWCLRAVEGCDREIRLYAVWCARRVQHLMVDARSVDVLDVAERFARGEASDEELEEARATARATARAAVGAAVRAAAWAAARAAVGAEAWVAAGAARNTERVAQAEELRRICREMREAGR